MLRALTESDPALAVEEPQQPDTGREHAPDADDPEGPRRADQVVDPKFWPKEPVMKDSGRKIVAMVVSCFITSFWRLLIVER
jgi:hypothetical protein